MNKTALLTICMLLMPTAAFATTGWGRHDTEVVGFRIVGTDGISEIYRLEASTRKNPPLFSNVITAPDGTLIRLLTPPDYAVTNNHLIVRYGHRHRGDSTPNHFAVSLADGVATKAMTAKELGVALNITAHQLKWRTPWTVADKFGATYTIVIAVLFIILLLIVMAVIYAVGKWIASVSNDTQAATDIDAV